MNELENTGGFITSLKQLLHSPYMLALFLLTAVNAVCSIMINFQFGNGNLRIFIPISTILFAIAFLMIYLAAAPGKDGLSLGGIKMTSVLIKIIRVILWIAVVVLAILAIALFAVPSLASNFSYELITAMGYANLLDEFTTGAAVSAMAIMFGVMVLIFAVVIIIINLFFYKNISKSIKSVISSIDTNEKQFNKLGTVKTWLIVVGVLSCISLLSSFVPPIKNGFIGILGNICSTAACFVGALLADKIDKMEVPQTNIEL